MSWEIVQGDCVGAMGEMDECSIDAVVCDPPYGLGFMGKEWDAGVSEGRDFGRWCLGWTEQALRVLKPGGYLLAFGGTRTYHRLGVAVEDAGFELRDSLIWLHGSGFPKSLDVSEALDKKAGHWRGRRGEVVGPNGSMAGPNFERGEREPAVTPEAKQWEGWGTALKPAHEPVVVGRKALEGTVAENVVAHGTGALNIDGCRVGLDTGRWPANVALVHKDECDEECAPGCPVPEIDRQSAEAGGAARFFYTAKAQKAEREAGLFGEEFEVADTPERLSWNQYERKNLHPTVKPIAVMRWLCRLVTPPGGLVLDPFAGSGTTGCAALLEGFNFRGVEREAEYVTLARARLEEHARQGHQMRLA